MSFPNEACELLVDQVCLPRVNYTWLTVWGLLKEVWE